MALRTPQYGKPQIRVTRSDHARLSRMANALPSASSTIADQLLAELDRARVVDDARIGSDVVRMGSTLRYVTDSGDERTVTLVFPGDADIAEGRVSILTPIGVALIGLSAGQSMGWTTRDGRPNRLTVEHVETPRTSVPDNAHFAALTA